MVVLAAGIMLVLAACENGNDTDNPIRTVYRLALSAIDGNSNKHILPVTITSTARSARTSVPDGQLPYSLNFGGVVISEGTVRVSNGLYTFTPTAGAEFTWNENTKSSTGSITINTAAKMAIENGAGGLDIAVPDTLTVESIMETQSGGGTWDGTWRRVKQDNTTYDMSWDNSDQQIIFSGNTYTLKYGDDIFETGTFLYCLPGDNSDSLFIFSRNIDYDPKIVTYLWEGLTEPDPDGYDDFAFLELYNWLWDAMEVGVSFNDDFSSRWFIKLPYSF